MSGIAIGFGDAGVRSTSIAGGPGNQKLFRYPIFSFDLDQSSKNEEVLAYNAGIHQVEDILDGSTTTTLKLSTEVVNWGMMGLAQNQIERTLTNFSLPRLKRATVPLTAPYEIVDTDLTAANTAKTLVSVDRFGTWGQTETLTLSATAPAARSVQINTAGTKLVFNAAQAGAPVTYITDQIIPAANVYGGPGQSAAIGEMEFCGTIYDNSNDPSKGQYIWIPRIKRFTAPKLNFAGGKAKLETEFRCLSVPGWTNPFMMLDLHSIA
jgi:hypothetical protein